MSILLFWLVGAILGWAIIKALESEDIISARITDDYYFYITLWPIFLPVGIVSLILRGLIKLMKKIVTKLRFPSPN